MKLFKNNYKYFVVFLLIILTTGCEKSIFEIEQSSVGDILSINSLKVYSVNEIGQILKSRQIPDSFAIKYSVKAIAIAYQTTDIRGNYILASGALFIPQNINNLPLLSIQHGTETKSDRVASINPLNSVEGVTGLLTASIGYLTCIPDYPGFGISFTLHPYHHAKSLTTAVIDFLIATQSYCNDRNISLNHQLFLSGYSEGGYVTFALQKEIEANYFQKFKITAVAPMAGPYDLPGTANQLLQQSSYRWPTYIAFLLYVYDNLYGWNRLDEIFNEPYYRTIPSLFDGSKSFAEINEQLPQKVNSLLNQNFIDDYLSGKEETIRKALKENTLLNWEPLSPIHFFHGDADNVAPYQNALTAVDSLKAHGAKDIRLTTIPGGTHETAGLPSVLGAIAWFETFRRNGQ
jgi:pimeloyl-ACP methyl ester carboxylesterase